MQVGIYSAVQILGGLLAALLAVTIFGKSANLAVTPGYGAWARKKAPGGRWKHAVSCGCHVDDAVLVLVIYHVSASFLCDLCIMMHSDIVSDGHFPNHSDRFASWIQDYPLYTSVFNI